MLALLAWPTLGLAHNTALDRLRLRLVQGRQRYGPPRRQSRSLPSHATVDRCGFVVAIAVIGALFRGLYLIAADDQNCRIKGNVSARGSDGFAVKPMRAGQDGGELGFDARGLGDGYQAEFETLNRKPALLFISVDGGPVLTTFMADPDKGLAACLRKAAEAVERECRALSAELGQQRDEPPRAKRKGGD